MKNNIIILCAMLLALSSCSVNNTKTTSVAADSATDQKTNPPVNKALFAKMQMKDTIKIGDSVKMAFTVYNDADSNQQFCKWHTPFEPLMSKYLSIKNENGEEVLYKGAMAKRMMPPPASSYIKVNAKDSLPVSVDVLKGYDISKPAKYTIVYEGQNMSGLIVKDSISFVYVK